MKKIIILIIILVNGFLIYRYFQKPTIISPLPEDSGIFNLNGIFSKKPKDISQIIPQIKNIIAQKKGAYSVYIYDLKTNKSAGINESVAYTGASLNKIPILAALYFETQNGKIDLDEKITVQKADIQDYGTGIIRNEGAGGVYSLKTLAQLMMEKSDNTAAYILGQKLTEKKIQELINSWGMVQTDMINNKTSNKDLSGLLIKIYQRKIVNESLTLEMLDFMNDSDFENRLPKGVPNNIKIYHKIGTEIGFVHDVGIVDLPENPYYIGVLSSDISDEVEAENTIANISKIVFEFMKK